MGHSWRSDSNTKVCSRQSVSVQNLHAQVPQDVVIHCSPYLSRPVNTSWRVFRFRRAGRLTRGVASINWRSDLTNEQLSGRYFRRSRASVGEVMACRQKGASPPLRLEQWSLEQWGLRFFQAGVSAFPTLALMPKIQRATSSTCSMGAVLQVAPCQP